MLSPQICFLSILISTLVLIIFVLNNPLLHQQIFYDNTNTTKVTTNFKLNSEDYYRVEVVTSPIPTINEVIQKLPWVQTGGHWNPPEVQNQSKLALILPYRDRLEHLMLFLQHMHPFLKAQSLDYTIFVVEQNGTALFNKGIVMDAAFLEILKMDNRFDCFIFHDVDLLPEDNRILYKCGDQPRHLTVAVNTMKYKLKYEILIGGALALTREQFEKANGYSTVYWGWGAEDDDMYYRLAGQNYTISRQSEQIARYTMLKHKARPWSKVRHKLLDERSKRFEGINNVNYTLITIEKKQLYTWILIDPPAH